MNLFPKRLPIHLQLSAADCGAACLAMIGGYWGAGLTIGDCQRLMGGSQRGVTALMIVQAARTLGLEVQAFRHTLDGLAQAPTPAILHWRGTHFVVLESWRGERVTVVDPALGRRQMTPADLAAGYSGVTLTFSPGPDFAQTAATFAKEKQAASWRTFLGRMWAVPGIRPLLAQLLGASLLLQLAGLILPVTTWLVVERILPEPGAGDLALLGMGLLLAMLAQTGVSYGRSLLAVGFQQRIDRHIIPDFFSHLLRLPYSFFQQRTTGDLLSRLEGNSAVRDLVTSGVLTGVVDGGLALWWCWPAPVWLPWAVWPATCTGDSRSGPIWSAWGTCWRQMWKRSWKGIAKILKRSR